MQRHTFKELPRKQEMRLFMEFNGLMTKYFPDSVADGVAGMSWCLGATIRAYINEGVFSEEALQFFGDAVSLRLPGEPRTNRKKE